MALIVADRVQETTTTTGTGTYTLAGAKDGYQSFAAVGDGNTCYYAITDGTDWETGIGTFTLSGTTLARTTIIESSNSDAAVNWGAGSKDIFVTAPADKTLLVGRNLYADNPSSPTAPSATGTNAVAIGSGASATGFSSFSFGQGASSTADQAFSFGLNAEATAVRSLSLFGEAGSTESTAIGYNSALQKAKTVTGSGAMALGGSRASGADSFAAAIDSNSSSYGASATNSIAMGKQAKATSISAVAIGESNSASALWACSIGGYQNIVSGGASIGGYRNNVSQNYAIAVGGYENTASNYLTVATGGHAVANIRGKIAHASNKFSANGDAQTGTLVLRSDTTDATAEALTSNNGTASTENQVILPNNSAYSFSGTIIARESAAAGSDYASWEIKGALLRDANAASTVLGNGIVNKLYATSGASAWAVALSADTTNGGLKIEVTGAASTNIRWVAAVNTSEVGYA